MKHAIRARVGALAIVVSAAVSVACDRQEGPTWPAAVEPPSYIAANPSSLARVFIALSNHNKVIVVRAVDDRIITEIPVGIEPYGLAVTPDQQEVWVTNFSSGSISIIDATNLVVKSTTPQGGDRPASPKISEL
jgi:YVTN family beta-propeller protein